MSLNNTTSRYEYGVSTGAVGQASIHAKLWSYRRLGYLPLHSTIHIQLVRGPWATQSLPWKLRAPFRACQQDRAATFLQSVFCFCSVATSVTRAPSLDASRHLRSSVGDHGCCLLVFFFSPFALRPRPARFGFLDPSSFLSLCADRSHLGVQKAKLYCIQIQNQIG